MPKWKKDAIDFLAHVAHHETRGYQTYVPKPVMEKLVESEHVKFIFKEKIKQKFKQMLKNEWNSQGNKNNKKKQEKPTLPN